METARGGRGGPLPRRLDCTKDGNVVVTLYSLANETQMCNDECAPDGSNSVEENGEWEDDFGT